MDAISFVLGVRASHLRGSNLKDLIYNVEGAAEQKASVTLVFERNDGTQIKFNRIVKGDGMVALVCLHTPSSVRLHTPSQMKVVSSISRGACRGM